MHLPKVFIDPGHGGSDPGASGHGVIEAPAALAVSRLIEQEVARYCDVKMSRNNNSEGPSLTQRANMANRWGADIFVSIHFNSATPSPTSKGLEVWHSFRGGRGRRLAVAIDKRLRECTPLGSRGLKSRESRKYPGQDYYTVIQATNMPAVICELGFLNDVGDAAYVASKTGQVSLARGVAQGILDYFNIQSKEVKTMFRDVSANHWARSSIERLATLGVLKGDDQGQYRPNDPPTRAELAVVVDRVLKLIGK